MVGDLEDYNKNSKEAQTQENSSSKGKFLGDEGSIHMVNTKGLDSTDNTPDC